MEALVISNPFGSTLGLGKALMQLGKGLLGAFWVAFILFIPFWVADAVFTVVVLIMCLLLGYEFGMGLLPDGFPYPGKDLYMQKPYLLARIKVLMLLVV